MKMILALFTLAFRLVRSSPMRFQAEERDLALQRLKRICDNDFISVLDFRTNPLRLFAAHELAAIIDPAMTTKMTVQVIDTRNKPFFYFLGVPTIAHAFAAQKCGPGDADSTSSFWVGRLG